jgi:hypothetical protein
MAKTYDWPRCGATASSRRARRTASSRGRICDVLEWPHPPHRVRELYGRRITAGGYLRSADCTCARCSSACPTMNDSMTSATVTSPRSALTPRLPISVSGARPAARALSSPPLKTSFADSSRGPVALPGNLGFGELREKGERFLPAEIAGLWWDGLGYPFLDYVHLGTAGDRLQGYRRLHFSG